MEFLDKTGVQTLWNKIKSGFIRTSGDQTISGWLSTNGFRTGGSIRFSGWVAQSFLNDYQSAATGAFRIYCNNQDLHISLINKDDFADDNATPTIEYIQFHTEPTVRFMDATSYINKTSASFCSNAFTLDSTGAYAKAFYESSDERLKENIQPITEETIAKAASVEIRQFNFKKDENKTAKYGVIAQEVEKEGLANLVSVNGDDELKSVDYTSLLCLKIKALEAKLEKMEKELQELKNK